MKTDHGIVMLQIDWHSEERPERGDLLVSAKTQYLVLRGRLIKRRDPNACKKYAFTCVRNHELHDEELRNSIGRSADRRGGQRIYHFYFYPRKKRDLVEVK